MYHRTTVGLIWSSRVNTGEPGTPLGFGPRGDGTRGGHGSVLPSLGFLRACEPRRDTPALSVRVRCRPGTRVSTQSSRVTAPAETPGPAGAARDTFSQGGGGTRFPCFCARDTEGGSGGTESGSGGPASGARGAAGASGLWRRSAGGPLVGTASSPSPGPVLLGRLFMEHRRG